MREFTDEEYNAIQCCKSNCYRSEGESFTLTSKRYTKKCIGYLNGFCWEKVDKSLSYELEITPADQPYMLTFRISGMVASFDRDGTPVVEYQDIMTKTIDYSTNRNEKNAQFWNEQNATEAGKIEAELYLVLRHFFRMSWDIINGYSRLIYSMKKGYRFTGIEKSEDEIGHCYSIDPKIFMK